MNCILMVVVFSGKVLRGRGVCCNEEFSELDWIGMKKKRARKRDEEEYK